MLCLKEQPGELPRLAAGLISVSIQTANVIAMPVLWAEAILILPSECKTFS